MLKTLDHFFGVKRYPFVAVTKTDNVLGISVACNAFSYMRVGEVIALRIFGVPVYRRVGSVYNVLGVTRRSVRNAS